MRFIILVVALAALCGCNSQLGKDTAKLAGANSHRINGLEAEIKEVAKTNMMLKPLVIKHEKYWQAQNPPSAGFAPDGSYSGASGRSFTSISAQRTSGGARSDQTPGGSGGSSSNQADDTLSARFYGFVSYTAKMEEDHNARFDQHDQEIEELTARVAALEDHDKELNWQVYQTIAGAYDLDTPDEDRPVQARQAYAEYKKGMDF